MGWVTEHGLEFVELKKSFVAILVLASLFQVVVDTKACRVEWCWNRSTKYFETMGDDRKSLNPDEGKYCVTRKARNEIYSPFSPYL